MSTFSDLRYDIICCAETRGQRFREVVFNTGMWAVISYRIRRWLYLQKAPWPIRKLMGFVEAVIKLATEIQTNIEIPASAQIGPGLCIPHTGHIVLNSGVIIGRNCTISTGVVMGHAGGGPARRDGSPRLGDRIYVGPGALLIGPIEIGDDALIAPGAVVVKSVPERAVVAGNPAKPISFTGSFELVKYPGMQADKQRSSSLQQVGSSSVRTTFQ